MKHSRSRSRSGEEEKEGSPKRKKSRFMKKRKKLIQRQFMQQDTKGLMRQLKNSVMIQKIWKSIGMKTLQWPKLKSRLPTTEGWLKKKKRWMKRKHCPQ